MEEISGLLWETERPLFDACRKSPKFCLLGYEWKFILEYFYFPSSSLGYKITLHKLTDSRPLDKGLKVAVYIRSASSLRCLNEITSSRDVERIVWSHVVKTADAELCSEMRRGKWTITFLFQSDQPLQLQLSGNETVLSSSQSVQNLQLSSAPVSKNLSKAVLSEDKCVQACSDIPPDLESLSRDFRQLLEGEVFSDVKLRCGDRNVSAHRSILAARSDVFTAMFRNKMVESETGTVDITDVDSEVLDLLLKYVYSGKIPDLCDETVSGLYEAGDKYCIYALKKSCSDWMVRNLTADNCLSYLLVADAHGDEDFKERVVDFAAEHLESIKKGAWTEFNKNSPFLAISVYQRHLAPTLSKQA